MFHGFSEETTQFLWGIRFNNERPWFEAHKQEYLDYVQTPMRALAQEVYAGFSQKHPELSLLMRVSRIYRDARRLYGRGPYKSHLWFSLRIGGEDWSELPVFWFEIHPAGYSYGMGIYSARPATMAKFRKDVDENPGEILALAKKFQKQSQFKLDAEEYKRKKGNPPAPLDQWYNRKSVDLSCDRPIDSLLYSRELVETLLDAFEELLPYYRYFSSLCQRAD